MMAGVIHDRRETQLAVDELNADGYSEDAIFVLSGERVCNPFATEERAPTFFAGCGGASPNL